MYLLIGQLNTLDVFVDRSVKYLRYVFVDRSVKYLRYVFVDRSVQGSHRLEKYLNIQDCLEKSLKNKFALKST